MSLCIYEKFSLKCLSIAKIISDVLVLQVDTLSYIGTTNSTPVLQMTWIHSCVAIDSSLNHLTVVVNGEKLEDKAFPIPVGAQPPSNLTERLLMFKQINHGLLVPIQAQGVKLEHLFKADDTL